MRYPKALGMVVCLQGLTFVFPVCAWCYVGPGVGITMLGTFWALVSFVGVLVAGMLVWPIKSFSAGRKKPEKTPKTLRTIESKSVSGKIMRKIMRRSG